MNTQNNQGGIGLFGATFLLLLALQCTGHIDKPWYVIATPLWLSLGVSVVVAFNDKIQTRAQGSK